MHGTFALQLNAEFSLLRHPDLTSFSFFDLAEDNDSDGLCLTMLSLFSTCILISQKGPSIFKIIAIEGCLVPLYISTNVAQRLSSHSLCPEKCGLLEA